MLAVRGGTIRGYKDIKCWGLGDISGLTTVLNTITNKPYEGVK
jgi:hypothetical protein